jgi:hypothetical protein
MTDRELLTLAAKAASVGVTESFDMLHFLCVESRVVWNPLENDGDALRLAVKLRMTVDVNHFFNKVEVRVYSGRSMFMLVEESEDIYAATRRAIVRAAAEIGKEMK